MAKEHLIENRAANRAINELLTASKQLAEEAEKLRFAEPVTHVYNPLMYAWKPYEQYVKLYAKPPKKALFLGMNPGPWGMVQTGVPFGEIDHVREWLGINGDVGTPTEMHPKRAVEGFSCTRSEVSGRRLWSFFEKMFTTPQAFFKDHFVANYCPLVFMENSGRNRTPDKLKPFEREKLFEICDDHIIKTVEILRPEWLIGIGGFAEKRLNAIVERTAESIPELDLKVCRILHPSPASPAANRGWDSAAEAGLKAAGVW